MAESKPIRPSTGSGQSSGLRILYMEDDPGLACLFRRRLERAGYIVDLARDGEEGLAMYDAGSYDVVVVDQTMPVRTGLEVIRILASRGPLPPVIMVTGTGSEQIAVEAMKLGVSDYIVKDVDGGYLELLSSVIEQVLRQQRLVEERERALEALRTSEEKLRSVIEQSNDSIILTDEQGTIIEWNRGAEQILGLQRAEALGRPLWEVQVLPEERRTPDAYERLKAAMIEFHRAQHAPGLDRMQEMEIQIQRPDGTCRVIHTSVFPIQTAHGFMIGGISRDITERKRAEETIKHMAYHDALTDLPNRVLFNDRLALELAHAQRNRQKLAVILLDLDNFKNVNDTLGHSVGDQLLQAVGERLTSLLRKSDTAARMGGDEFMLIFPEIAREEDAAKIAQKILEAIQRPFVLDDHEIHVTTSLGIASYPKDGEDGDTLIKNADIAMYRAKEQGRNNYQRYSSK